MTPNLYLIAGPNGAGKTTFAREFLPEYVHCREFLNADLLAAGLAPFEPETAAIRAGRLLLARIKELSERGRDFGFETTLAGRSYAGVLRRMKSQGYAIHLFFLWLPNVEMAIARVAHRVGEGGHDIPEAVIRRRFTLGIRNLFGLYRPLLDSWMLVDNSGLVPDTIASEQRGTLNVVRPGLFQTILREVEDFKHG
jgi:predicted ABC-type ATPase